MVGRRPRPPRDHRQHGIGAQPPQGETQGLGRWAIHPLRVVDRQDRDTRGGGLGVAQPSQQLTPGVHLRADRRGLVEQHTDGAEGDIGLEPVTPQLQELADVRPVEEGLQQGGLAETGLGLDQDHLSLPRPGLLERA